MAGRTPLTIASHYAQIATLQSERSIRAIHMGRHRTRKGNYVADEMIGMRW